jgi:hypothetical protein
MLIAQVKTDTLKSGAGFWKPPIGCNSFYVELWGGGAGGNTGSGDGSLSTGGGGGGSYAKSTNFTVTSSTFSSGYQFSVGAGAGVGGNGGDTWFDNTLCLAPGGKTRGNAQQKSPLNQFIQTSYLGGGGGSSWRNVFNQIWHGGGGAAGRRLGDGYVGGNADFNVTGGGAEGYAYDNVNVTPGRGGQDGPYFPGVPGGGGAGNQSGASGIIIIFYTCNYSPGSIKESHTVPFPAEWGPFNDVISNVTPPTALGGYRLKWEGSKNNITWDSLGMGSGLNTFVQDSITLNTYYRRTIANGCGTDNSTPPVLIKVFKATTGKNGAIKGRVTSINGTTGVGGVTITIQKTIALKGSPQSYKYITITNSNGDYNIDTLFYGDRDNGDVNTVNFTVVASLAGHRISTISQVPLTFNSNESLNNNFIDSTVYSITGRVTQSCTTCLPTYQGPFGAGNVKISDGTGINDVYTDSLREKQDSIGYFAMAIANPGNYNFTPTFLNHKFNPINRSISVTNDRFNINFLDTTTRLISGKLTDVAGRRLSKKG